LVAAASLARDERRVKAPGVVLKYLPEIDRFLLTWQPAAKQGEVR